MYVFRTGKKHFDFRNGYNSLKICSRNISLVTFEYLRKFSC